MDNDFESFWEKTVRGRCQELSDGLHQQDGEYQEAERQYSEALHQVFPMRSDLSECMENAVMNYLVCSDIAMYRLGLRDGLGFLRALGVLT